MERPNYKPIARVFVQSIFFSPSFRDKTMQKSPSIRRGNSRESRIGKGVPGLWPLVAVSTSSVAKSRHNHESN
jgi:hypothetical protein